MKSYRMMRCVVAAGLLCGAVSAAQEQSAAPADPIVAMVKQAGELSNAGKHDEALALYRKVLEAKPDSYPAQLGAGIALDLKGEYQQARKHLARAIELAPPQNRHRALRTMAMSYAFEGKADESARYEQQVLDERLAKGDFEGAAEIANEQARVFLELGDIDKAEDWYRQGHQTALRKSDLTEKQKALWDFRWEHAQARIAARRGQHEPARKHVAAARTALDKAAEPDQEQYFPYLTGYVAFYAGDYPAAIADLEKANQRDPFILSLLAQAHEKSGDQAKAQEYYRKVLESTFHNPTNAFARPLAKQKLKGAK